MKKFLKKLMAIILMVITSIGFASCGGSYSDEDNEDGYSNELIQTLKSNKWISRDTSYGEGDDYHAWIDVETNIFYFTSNNSGVSYWIQRDYDTHLGNSTTKDYVLFTYSVSGNTVTITYENDNVSKWKYEDGYLVSEGGSIICEPSPMTSEDYNLVSNLGPKTEKCGNNLTYSYDDRTKTLTISGTGRMNDYTSSNQPWHNYNISEVVIEEGCTYIGSHAFHKTKYSISKIELPNSLQEIGEYACCDLFISELMVPTELVKIGSSAFSDCKYLKKVNFAGCNVLEEIGENAFTGCPINMTYFSVPQNVKKIGSYAFVSSTFSSLKLNDRLEYIGEGAFGEIDATYINIPNSVKHIGSLAFRGNFSEIRIGTGLRTIGETPFQSLRSGSISSRSGSLYVNLGTPLSLQSSISQYFIADKDGNNAASSWTLYVPSGCKSAYQNALGWKTFKSIIEDVTLIRGN